MTDKQSAFVTGLAKVFPGVPHRFCKIHFLRALAKDVLASDSHVKVTMRKKVRGLRAIEQEAMGSGKPSVATATNEASPSAPRETPAATAVLSEAVVPLPPTPDPITPPSSSPVPVPLATTATVTPGAAVVLDYCTVVRGILIGEHGDPLHPT